MDSPQSLFCLRCTNAGDPGTTAGAGHGLPPRFNTLSLPEGGTASHFGKKEPVNCKMKERRSTKRGGAFAIKLSLPIRNVLLIYCKTAEAQAIVSFCNVPNTSFQSQQVEPACN